MKPDSQMTLDRHFRQCVGIDVSKDKFTACLQMYDRASDVGCHTMSIDFDNTKSGFNQFVKWSRKEAVKGFPLTYLMEPTGVYYEPLAYQDQDRRDGCPLPGPDGMHKPQAEAMVASSTDLP